MTAPDRPPCEPSAEVRRRWLRRWWIWQTVFFFAAPLPLFAWADESTAVIGDGLAEPAFWIWMGGISALVAFLQWVLLRPARAPERSGRPVPLVWSMIVVGLVVALLQLAVISGFAGVVNDVANYRPRFLRDDDTWFLIFAGAGVEWIVATVLLTAFVRRSTQRGEHVRRFATVLFAGTVLDVVASVPLELIARKHESCWCGRGTFHALILGLFAGSIVCGPVVFWLLLAQRRRRWPGGRCPACDADVGPGLRVAQCPACGVGWRRASPGPNPEFSRIPRTVPGLAFGVEPSDRAFRLRLARYPALALSIADFVAGVPEGRPVRLLDVGVGRGRSLRYTEPLGVTERIRWHGIDLDPRMPERLHRRDAWRAALADVSRGLPFRDGAFDIVLCEQLLEHLDDPAAALAEIARVLRPNGLLIAGVPTFPPGIAALRSLVAHVVSRDDAKHGHGHVRTFSAWSFRRLVERSGAFDIEDARGFRSASGGLLAPLEDRRWWWRLNAVVFGAFPSLSAEVQLVALRRVVEA